MSSERNRRKEEGENQKSSSPVLIAVPTITALAEAGDTSLR
jgi:hypothetical protein